VTYKGSDNDKHIARDLNGNEKWLLFTYVSETELDCFNTTFPEIKKIKEIHKVRHFNDFINKNIFCKA